MAYIIPKKSKANGKVRNLYYLVVGYRESGKVKQRTVLIMGEYPTIDACLKGIYEAEIKSREGFEHYRREAEKVEEDLKNGLNPNYIKVKRAYLFMAEREKTKLAELTKWHKEVLEAKEKYKVK